MEQKHAPPDFEATSKQAEPDAKSQDETAAEQTTAEEVVHPNVWLCQYRPGDRVTRWTEEAVPGATIRWKTSQRALPAAMQAGDPLIYWRTIHPDDPDDRGGIVGTGHVVSPTLEPDKDGTNRFPTEVHEFFDADPLPRDEVIKFAAIRRKVWQGAVLDLPAEQAKRIDLLLRERGRMPLFEPKREPSPPPPRASADGQLRIRRDDAEKDHDALGRAPLAVALGWTLHEIWCTEQGLAPYPARQPAADTAGFVAQVDAPWGGGKTTFANLLIRTLNPDYRDAEEDPARGAPHFLRNLYPDRTDMSGLFISATHEPGNLTTADGRYRWHQDARRPWIVVPFNAWLHQHVEPPWWCFYQAIRKGCFRAIRREGLPLVEQESNGSYRTRREAWLNRHWRWTRLWAKELWWRVTNQVTLPLLVATAILFVGLWLFGIGEWSGVIAFLTSAGAFLMAAANFIADLLAPGRNVPGERTWLGFGDPLARFRRHFARMMRDIRRPVLVCVDDIDRCRPEFVVELTRGLQTILRSPRVVYLILGDRKWIEKAFEVCNQGMSDIDVGPEHTFGGRFVEKAIQLSFILPAIADQQQEYVREVLLGRDARTPASATSEAQDAATAPDADGSAQAQASFRADVRAGLSNDQSIDDIDERGEALERESANRDHTYRQTVREEVILRRAAQKQTVEQAIRHRLQPLAPFLPGNPRHIKRIVNAISMYQDSILLTEESFEEAGFGGQRWRELVLGVILMMGYPKSWSAIAADPSLADELAQPADNQSRQGTGTERDRILAELRANGTLVTLVTQADFSVDTDAPPQITPITSETVLWLNRVIPVNG